MTDRSQARLWPIVESIKRRIVQLFDVPQHLGVKLAAIKAYQRIILVQTRAAADAKYPAAGKSSADANVGQVSADHPVLRSGPLEQEANERLTQVVTVIFTGSNPDIVMASMNSLALLAKMRPTLSPIVLEALVSWTPSALASQAYTTVRSVEKTLRLLYQHFHPSRNSLAGPYASQIVEAVDNQKLRMDTAAREEARRARERNKEREEGERAAASAAAAAAAVTTAQAASKRPGTAGQGQAARRKRVRFAGADDDEQDPDQDQHHPPAAMPSRATPPPSSSAFPTDPMSAAIAALPALQKVYDVGVRGDAIRLAPPDAAGNNPMAAFDVTTLPPHLVTELVVANLQAVDNQSLQRTIHEARQRVSSEVVRPSAPPPTGPAAMRNEAVPAPPPSRPPPGPPPSLPPIKSEEETAEPISDVQDPLKLDMGEEETLEQAQRRLEETTEYEEPQGDLTGPDMEAYSLKPPADLGEQECKTLMHASVGRICRNGVHSLATSSVSEVEQASGSPTVSAQLWAVLVTRLATRGLNGYVKAQLPENGEESALSLQTQSDAIRQLMLEFVVADLAQRMEFALQWMAEEFHCELLARKYQQTPLDGNNSLYAVWLQRLTEATISKMDSKDKSLHEFLSRVPSLPDGIIGSLQILCLDKSRMAAGFTMLRDLAITRVPSRAKTCSILLGLARNEEKMVRGASIITVRNWVRVNGQGQSPAGDALEHDVLEYAKQALHRLTVRNTAVPATNGSAIPGEGQNAGVKSAAASESSERKLGDDGGVLDDEDDEEPEEKSDGSGYPSALDNPTAEIILESDVVRLVELPFALCVRVSDMLDEVFHAYPNMPSQVQAAVDKHIRPLIQNLGPNHTKLLSLIQLHPPGAESLAVCAFSVVTEKQRSKKIVDLVKQMASERSDVDARFLIPILPDLEKAEIIRLLPRVVSILASEKPEDRATIKSVFTSIVAPPEQGFGSVSTNLPRVRQSELLSPVELMSLLHHADKDVGLKTAAEAIRICFGMTEIFRSEVIGAVLNQLVEEPNLPVLFMRTAIMAVRTYRSLSSYISTIFLSRLITKKVWQQPLLWDGFVLCAKQTAPASFGALIQLPREQLRDVIGRQPDLRVGLREYLVRKAGGHRGRLNTFLELLDGDGDGAGAGEAADASAAAAGGTNSGQGTPTGTPTPVPTAGTPGSHASTPQPQHASVAMGAADGS